MNYDEFMVKVKEAVELHLESDVNVEIRSVEKNNLVKMKGICMKRKEDTVAPIIYLESYWDLYRNGMEFDEVIDKVVVSYRAAQKLDPGIIGNLWSWEKVKSRILCKLVNREWNQEYIRSVPCREFLDLCIVCYLSLPEYDSTVAVDWKLLDCWRIGVDELLEEALKNTRILLGVKFWKMKDYIGEWLEEQKGDGSKEELLPENETMDFYVMTNYSKNYGASVILDEAKLEEVGEVLNSDYYVLPSSVHEVIIVPGNEIQKAKELAQMVYEVNTTLVPADEILSNHVYLFSRERHELEIAA